MKTDKKGKKNMEELKWKYVKELKDENAIKQFEDENDFKFEEEFKDIVKQYNGGRPRPNTFDTQKRKECVFKSLLSFNKGECDIFEVKKWIENISNEKLIPFASEPSGNYICFDNNHNVVSLIHETGKIEFISKSFSEFLNKLYE